MHTAKQLVASFRFLTIVCTAPPPPPPSRVSSERGEARRELLTSISRVVVAFFVHANLLQLDRLPLRQLLDDGTDDTDTDTGKGEQKPCQRQTQPPATPRRRRRRLRLLTRMPPLIVGLSAPQGCGKTTIVTQL